MIADPIAEDRPSPPHSGRVQPEITLRSTVTDLEQQVRTFSRQRPVVAVLAAVGVGYLVARLFSRVRT
jgi:hypothetical protein